MGREFVVNLIKAWLIHLNEITNAKQKLSPSSINFIADTIYDDYSLRVTDLYLFFRKVRKNDYGKFYENISEGLILSWWAQYYDERCNAAHNVRSKEHKAFNVNTDKMHPEVFKEAFKGVGDIPVTYEEVKAEHKNGVGTRLKNRLK